MSSRAITLDAYSRVFKAVYSKDYDASGASHGDERLVAGESVEDEGRFEDPMSLFDAIAGPLYRMSV